MICVMKIRAISGDCLLFSIISTLYVKSGAVVNGHELSDQQPVVVELFNQHHVAAFFVKNVSELEGIAPS
jgi:hypothetical protein